MKSKEQSGINQVLDALKLYSEQVDKKMDKIKSELEERVEAGFKRVDQRFEQVDKRFERLEKKFDK
ncbi:hypothetical protein GH754_16335 [Salinibacillus xinjiangensis]|uniref:Uncharacterized protein n=1 Tax=Salinibacillus xinjiangensis TaxID=1229268 RepID=A0A6G1X9Z4_9BACI|nr:hypothetical protein [Salinibacillus xinjiangensis]